MGDDAVPGGREADLWTTPVGTGKGGSAFGGFESGTESVGEPTKGGRTIIHASLQMSRARASPHPVFA